MRRTIARALLLSVLAAAAGRATPPKFYRIALIQVAYKGKPARYTADQLKAAADEISTYFSRISYLNLNLDIVVSSVMYEPPPCVYPCLFPLPPIPFDFDKLGYALPDPGNASVVQAIAEIAARSPAHVDFSGIDGIAILSSFSTPPDGDYMAGTITVAPPSPAAGTHETAQLSERIPDITVAPPGPSGVFWATWAPVIGKMIAARSGNPIGGFWQGHPSSLADGYALMDSCWPCAPSAYSVLGTDFMKGMKQVFNGWLPDSQVAVDAADFTSRIYTLSPLASLVELVRPCPSCIKVLKAPITPTRYYLVEARTRTSTDSLFTVFGGRGVWDEGIHITHVDESADPPVHVMNPCDSTGGCVESSSDPRFASCRYGDPVGYSVATLPPYCWPYPLFHVGDTFFGEHGIQIRVESSATDVLSSQYLVRVTRGPVFTAPDVSVVRRDPSLSVVSFSVSGIPRHHLWIDSSCNGYAANIGPSGLRFGDPAQAQGLAVGDDLCLGHENRIYARIENRGNAPAVGLRVHFDIGDPAADQGPCVSQFCPPPFTEVGVADAQHFPALASLAPGSHATVYVAYTPAANELTQFTTPALRVRIDPPPDETSTGDNIAESAFGRVEAWLDNSRQKQVHAPDLVYTAAADLKVLLNRAGNLPRGVTVSTGQGTDVVNLAAGQTLRLPVDLAISGQITPAAGRYAANITVNAFVPSSGPFGTRRDFKVLAVRTVGIDLVESLGIHLKAGRDNITTGTVEVQGRLQGLHANAIVSLDYTGRNKLPATMLVRTDHEGEFTAQLQTAPGSAISALWMGDETHAAMTSGPVFPSREQ